MSSDPHLESLILSLIPEAIDIDGLSTYVDERSFPPRSNYSLPMANENGDELDSSILGQKELTNNCTGLLSPRPIYGSDVYDASCCSSYLQAAAGSNAITHRELDSTTFMLEAVVDQPSIEEGSRLNYFSIDNATLSATDHHQVDNSSEELSLLLQEISSSTTPLSLIPSTGEKTRDDHDQTADRLVPEQESSALSQPISIGKGNSSLTAKRLNANTRERNCSSSRLKRLRWQARDKEVDHADKGEAGSTVKKQEHNAKERMRRMKIHASYLALGALLPDSSRSKKRKSAPLIIDRAVEYIPKLEEEIEKLSLRKNNMLSKFKNKQPLNLNPDLEQHPSVSVHGIKNGEVIIQICMQRSNDPINIGDVAFSNLLQKLEEEEEEVMCIVSASTLQVSDDGVCYHLHIQMNASLEGANRLASLREKVISWLRPLFPRSWKSTNFPRVVLN